jgi:hypothetical protein
MAALIDFTNRRYDHANSLQHTDGKFRAGEYEYDINIKYNAFDRKILLISNLILLITWDSKLNYLSLPLPRLRTK